MTEAKRSTQTQIIAELITCGADPSVDRMLFQADAAGRDAAGNRKRFATYPVSHRLEDTERRALTRSMDESTRRALAELCVGPRRLQTLSACVVRNCLAAAEFDGVVKNADRLPLPPVLQALVKLELTDI